MKFYLLVCLTLTTTAAFAQKDTTNICSKIEERFDEFDNIKTFNTELMYETKMTYGSVSTHYGADFIKTIKKGKITYYLSLETSTVLADATQYGITILLKNGTKIRKPQAEVKTDVDNNGDYRVSTFIRLLPADILLLKKSPIIKFKLYVDQGVVERPDDVYQMFLCLLTRK